MNFIYRSQVHKQLAIVCFLDHLFMYALDTLCSIRIRKRILQTLITYRVLLNVIYYSQIFHHVEINVCYSSIISDDGKS
jgi:hypothetical protein